MALFGAPIAHEDHAARACYAALALQEVLRRYANELRLEKGINFSVRMGLNSGSSAAAGWSSNSLIRSRPRRSSKVSLRTNGRTFCGEWAPTSGIGLRATRGAKIRNARGNPSSCITGTPEEIVAQLRTIEEAGIREITLWPPMDHERKVFRDFAELVMPAFQ
jgi:alkanesulfonate monooxygenase SsuD/methylene tetrahydromethanopterin reductase-like flavin-dependent oxidoreductase (luciferase family)